MKKVRTHGETELVKEVFNHSVWIVGLISLQVQKWPYGPAGSTVTPPLSPFVRKNPNPFVSDCNSNPLNGIALLPGGVKLPVNNPLLTVMLQATGFVPTTVPSLLRVSVFTRLLVKPAPAKVRFHVLLKAGPVVYSPPSSVNPVLIAEYLLAGANQSTIPLAVPLVNVTQLMQPPALL